MIKNITDKSFKEEVLDSSTPVFVDFWATWCGPCQMLAPVIEQLDQELGDKIKFTKLNVDENPTTSAQFEVMSIPTMIIFKDGQMIETIIGFLGKEQIKNRILAVL